MIDPISPASSTASTNTAALSAEADFESFLKLLTAEISHQDPLKPMDSTEFVSQLASFSAVEQQLRTNDTLDTLVTLLSADTEKTASAWLGKSAEFTGAMGYQGTPIAARFETALQADSIVEVRDKSGALLDQFSLSAGATEITWPSTDSPTPPHGALVTFERRPLEGTDGLRSLALVTDDLSELRLSGSDAYFVTASGAELRPDEVRSLIARPQS